MIFWFSVPLLGMLYLFGKTGICVYFLFNFDENWKQINYSGIRCSAWMWWTVKCKISTYFEDLVWKEYVKYLINNFY